MNGLYRIKRILKPPFLMVLGMVAWWTLTISFAVPLIVARYYIGFELGNVVLWVVSAVCGPLSYMTGSSLWEEYTRKKAVKENMKRLGVE